MSKVNLEAHDAIAVLRLYNGVTNAISPKLVDDLSETIKQIKNGFKGMVLAGGAIFALSSDFRFASSGRRLIGFNEVKIGLPTPYLADSILRQIVGDRCATELMFTGEFVETQQAQKIGLIDDVLQPKDLEQKTIAKIAELAALPPSGITVVKNNRIEAVKSKYEELRSADADWFLGCWFNPAVQELLQEAAKKF
jgi:enoyl-CoA hydratase/carnithine racemase